LDDQNQLVSFEDRYAAVSTWLLSADTQEQMALALPKHVDPGRLARQFLTQCKKIPKLVECSGSSLAGGLMEVAQLGLDLGTRGHAWLLPYKVQGTMTANLIVGYKGMLDLAWRSDQIRSVYAHAVYEGDDFQYEFGTNQYVRHIPCGHDVRGDIIFAYAGCETIHGGKMMDVMLIEDVNAIRQRAKARDKGPWVTDYAEMCKKTAVRRVLKLGPCSTELQRAITLDEEAEVGVKQTFTDEVTMTPEVEATEPTVPTGDDVIRCEECKREIVIDSDGGCDDPYFRYAGDDTGDAFRCAECGAREGS
jgi:recombination protein RecT